MNTYQRQFELKCQEANQYNNWLSTIINHTFHVSTCYRTSSEDSNNAWYYETFIFCLNNENQKVLIGDATGTPHHEVCEWIIKNGEWDQERFDSHRKMTTKLLDGYKDEETDCRDKY
jgi:hypothetical protein